MQESPKRYGFRLGAIPLTGNEKLQTGLTNSEGTLKYQLRSYATSCDVITKYADIIIDSVDAPVTIVRGPLNSIPTFLGFKDTPWNLPSISSKHLPVMTDSLLIAIIYPLIQLQLTMEDIHDNRFNKDPAELFTAFFLNNPEDCLGRIQAHLNDIHKRSHILQQECASLNFMYEVTTDKNSGEEQLEFYLCIAEKPQRITSAKPTAKDTTRHFFMHNVKNFVTSIDDALYVASLFYWLAWALGGIIVSNIYNYVIPGNLFLSATFGVGVSIAFVALLYSKKIFIWIDNHFDLPQFGFWNTWIKPCFDHPTQTFWPSWPDLPVAPTAPNFRQRLFRLALHLARFLSFIMAIPFLPFLFIYACFSGVQASVRIIRWLTFISMLPIAAIAMPFVAVGGWYSSDWGKYRWLKWIFALSIVPLLCWGIASLCGVNGKNDKDVYYLTAEPNIENTQFKNKYKNSYIIFKPETMSTDYIDIADLKQDTPLVFKVEPNKLYYVDQNGDLVENPLKMSTIPYHIRQLMEEARGTNLSGAAREWVNQQITTNSDHAKKATSSVAEKFSEITRELAILNQYDKAETQVDKISVPIAPQNNDDRINIDRGEIEEKKLPLHQSPSLALDEKSTEPPLVDEVTTTHLTSWFMPPETTKFHELLRFFWLTFMARLLRFEYALWFVLVALVYTHFIAAELVDAFFASMWPASIAIVAFSFVYAIVKTFYDFKEEKSYRGEKNTYAKQKSGPDIYVVDQLDGNANTRLPQKYYGSYIFEKSTHTTYYIYPKECDFALMSKAGSPDINLFSRNTYVYNRANNTFYYVDKSHTEVKTIAVTPDTHNITITRLRVQLDFDDDDFNPKDTAPKFLIENLSTEQLEKLQRITGHQHPTGTRIALPAVSSQETTWNKISTEIPSSLTTPLQRLTAQQQQYMLPLLWNQIAANPGHDNQPVLQEQRFLQKISDLKNQVLQKNTALAYSKLKLAAAGLPIPADPDIPDATTLENLTSLKRKKRFSSSITDFFRNPYWLILAVIGVFVINSIFPARLFFLNTPLADGTFSGTGVTTSLLQMPIVAFFHAIHVTFSPLISTGFLLLYIAIHASASIYKARQESRDAARKQQYVLGPLQETCLKRQLTILGKHQAYLANLLSQLPDASSSTPTGIDATAGKNLEYADLYPDPDLSNFAIQRIWRDKIAYLLAGLALTCLFSVFALSFIPTFAAFLSVNLILGICVPIVTVSILALFAHFLSKDHTLNAREKNITIFLLLGLIISLISLVFLYTTPFDIIYLSLPPTLIAAIFFATTFKIEDSDAFLADEFLAQKEFTIERILSPEENHSILLQDNDKELMVHAITLLRTAINPNGNGRRISAAEWGGHEAKLEYMDRKEQMLHDFAYLQRFQQQIEDEEPIHAKTLTKVKNIITRYKDSPPQAEPVHYKKPSVNKQQFIETVSFIFLIIVACLIVYLPAVFLVPVWLQWLLATAVIAFIVPKMITERFIKNQERDLVLMSESPTTENIDTIQKKAFVLFGLELFYIDKSTSPIVTPLTTITATSYQQLQIDLGFADLGARESSKRVVENVSYEKLFKLVPNAKQVLTKIERCKFFVAQFFSIKILTTITLATVLITLFIGGFILPMVTLFGGYAVIPSLWLAPWMSASLFLMQATLKYITMVFDLNAYPTLKWWAAGASKFFLVLDMIALGSLAFGLPVTAFLILTGIFTIPTTMGLVGVSCVLPVSFLILKFLLPRVLIAYTINEGDDPKKIADTKEDIENGCKLIGYGLSFAICITAVGLVLGAGFLPSLAVICSIWGLGLAIGHRIAPYIFENKSFATMLHGHKSTNDDKEKNFSSFGKTTSALHLQPVTSNDGYTLLSEEDSNALLLSPISPSGQSKFDVLYISRDERNYHKPENKICRSNSAPAGFAKYLQQSHIGTFPRTASMIEERDEEKSAYRDEKDNKNT